MTAQLPLAPTKGVVIVEDYELRIQRVSCHDATPSSLIIEEDVISAWMPEDASTVTSVRVVKPAGQHSNWRAFAEKPLWIFFANIRQIHLTYPDNASIASLHREIKEELYNRYLGDTLKMVRKYMNQSMPKFSLLYEEDLKIAAQMSMWQYLDQFDPNFGTITFMQYFNAHGASRLYGSIVDCLRSLQDFPRYIALWRRLLKPMIKTLADELKHDPTNEEILDRYGWDSHLPLPKGGHTKKNLRTILQNPLLRSGVFNQRQHTSLDGDSINEDEIESLAQHAARPAANVDRLSRQDARIFILSHLPDQDMRYIIEAYYWYGDTYKRICQSLNAFGRSCSQSWVKCMHDKAETILREKLDRKQLTMLVK